MKTRFSCIALAGLLWAGERIGKAEESASFSTDKKAASNTTAESTEYNNWLELSFGDSFLGGDKAQFQRRHALPAGPFGGIEDFHFEAPVKKKGLFSIDGRAIFNNHDYLLKLDVSHPDKGFVRFGYREFRTWYDGSSGFFPSGTNHWFPIYDEDLHIDRGAVWFEAGLRIPERPELTFRYSHEFRDGKKDSTVWGDTALLGLASPNNLRGIVPSFWKIDERRDIFALDAKHTISKTDVGMGVRYDLIDNNNSRNIHRRPGELTGTATQATDRFVTQREKFESDMFNAHAFTETRLNEKLLFTTGYSFTRLNTDIGGSRIYGADYDPIYDPLFGRRQQRDEGFLDLRGGSEVNQYVMNLNVMFLPLEALTIVPAVRIEHQDQDGDAAFTETNFGAPPARAPINEDLFNTRQWKFTDVSEALEARYTGVTNWVFYARGEWLQGQGDLRERQADNNPDDPAATNSVILRDTDSDRLTQKYVAGINWYPLRRMNLAAQYYHKIRENDYTHNVDSTANAPSSNNRYPAYPTVQDFETDDVNFRLTLRPMNSLTLVSRYDFQLSTVDTKADLLDEVQSAEMTSHIFAQSISWVPFLRLYLQGSFNYALDEVHTPANDFMGSATNNIVPRSENDYWNAGALVGYALDEKTDVQAQYFYYRSRNYVDNSLYSQPYGASAEEQSVTVSLIRQLTKSLRWTLKYGLFCNRDKTSGHHNDYTAHMVYSSIQIRF